MYYRSFTKDLANIFESYTHEFCCIYNVKPVIETVIIPVIIPRRKLLGNLETPWE